MERGKGDLVFFDLMCFFLDFQENFGEEIHFGNLSKRS